MNRKELDKAIYRHKLYAGKLVRPMVVLHGPPPDRIAKVFSSTNDLVRPMLLDDALYLNRRGILERHGKQSFHPRGRMFHTFMVNEQLLSKTDWYLFEDMLVKARRAGVRL